MSLTVGKKLVKTLIRSVALYSTEIWGDIEKQNDRNKSESFEMRCVEGDCRKLGGQIEPGTDWY